MDTLTFDRKDLQKAISETVKLTVDGRFEEIYFAMYVLRDLVAQRPPLEYIEQRGGLAGMYFIYRLMKHAHDVAIRGVSVERHGVGYATSALQESLSYFEAAKHLLDALNVPKDAPIVSLMQIEIDCFTTASGKAQEILAQQIETHTRR